ncbi:MAG: flagellar export protein FliJ [Pseudomonadota bacterium]
MKSKESLIRLKRFQVDEKRRRVSQIETMIADFQRNIDDLEDQIQYEQEKSGISDPTHFAYPTFAKAAMVRRDNLKASQAELGQQLETARDVLAGAYEELKKFEMLEERNERITRDSVQKAEQDEMDEMAARAATG